MLFLCKNTAFLPSKSTIHTPNLAKIAVFAEFASLMPAHSCKNRPILPGGLRTTVRPDRLQFMVGQVVYYPAAASENRLSLL